MEEQKTEDYKERLQKVRQRRNGKDPMHWFMIGGCAVIVVLALVIIVKLAQGGTFGGSGNARVASASEAIWALRASRESNRTSSRRWRKNSSRSVRP